jgi:CP family cyanate transporter-like MFS transporter
LLGIGQGGAFSLALSLLVLRAPDAHVAAHLSGMAQGVGYTVAACGRWQPASSTMWPDWAPVGWLFGGIAATALAAGLLAGRKLLVSARRTTGLISPLLADAIRRAAVALRHSAATVQPGCAG